MPLHLGTRVSSLASTSCRTRSKRCKDNDSWREKASGLEAKELKSVCGRHGDGRDVSHHPEWELPCGSPPKCHVHLPWWS